MEVNVVNEILPNLSIKFSDFDVYVIVGVCLGFEFLVKPIFKKFKWFTSDVIQIMVILICALLVGFSSSETFLKGMLQGVIDGALCNVLYDLIVSKFTKNKKEEKIEEL